MMQVQIELSSDEYELIVRATTLDENQKYPILRVDGSEETVNALLLKGLVHYSDAKFWVSLAGAFISGFFNPHKP